MRLPSYLTLTLAATFISQAQEVEQCYVPKSFEEWPTLANEQTIKVTAGNLKANKEQVAQYTNGVEIVSAESIIKAEQATFDNLNQKLTASGNVQYRDRQIIVGSNAVKLNIASGELLMEENQYDFVEFNGRGEAREITLAENEVLVLENVSFTTCPIDQADWQIEASEIEIERDKKWGTVKNAKFYIADIPVFYLPYFQFPLTDERESGLLPSFDKITTSEVAGFSFEQPIYWNIAPNYDATFSPRILTERGIQFKGQFRYLTRNTNLPPDNPNSITLEFLDGDKDTETNEDRYFYRFVHSSNLNENWVFNADINGLSDDNYIIDFGSDYFNRADTNLFQTLSIDYFSENLDFHAAVRDFEVIGDSPIGYRALPEITLDYRAPDLGAFKFDLYSEFNYFDSSDSSLPTASRLHIAPRIQLPYKSESLELLAETTLLQTFYQQEQLDGFDLEENVSRTLGQARLFGAINFERESKWKGKKATQTLEPKIQYLYTSFEDQSGIGIFDTTRLINDFEGLFRGQDFTGIDRIADTNQFTLGVTTRILDENNREQLKLSLGQIFFINDNRVLEATNERNRSALATEIDWRIDERWYVHSEVQLSTETEKVERSTLSIDFRASDNKLIQFSHRFIRDLSNEQIDQFGVTASWPISKKWLAIGRWYTDFELNRTIESYFGVQYQSCCWSIHITAQRHLINRFDFFGQQNVNDFDSGINLGFRFLFGEADRKKASRKLLQDGLFGYRQPYFLSN
jgi:LPS-assembly protein